MSIENQGQTCDGAVRIAACCRVSVREADIFRLWLQHYAPYVDKIAVVLVVEAGDDAKELEELCQSNRVIFECWNAKRFHPGSSMCALERVVRTFQADWMVHADSDEFLKEIANIRAIVDAADAERADYGVAWMADRLAFGGRTRSMKGIGNVEDLEAAFPVRAAVTERLAKGCSYKVCLTRWPSLGAIHSPGPALRKKMRKRLTLEHFKWRDGLEERLRKRIRDHAASKLPWGGESRRILSELGQHRRIRAERYLAPRSRHIPGFMDYESVYLNAVTAAPDCAHFVEVGVWQGRSLCFLAEAALAAGKKLRIDGIDPFRNYNRRRTGYPSSLRARVTKHSWLDLAAQNLRNAGMLDYVNLIQACSPEASRLYADEQLDFVWLDGDHSYRAVLADLQAWWPKIKAGGFLAGHDFWQPQVKRALKAAQLQGAEVTESRKHFLLRKRQHAPVALTLPAAAMLQLSTAAA